MSKMKIKKDPLGARIKNNYENITRYELPKRTYTILRLDGRAFHTYTKGLKKPFDESLSNSIDQATIKLMNEISGSVMAYNQSDEISILLYDFATIQTQPWFGNNLQKICSVSASILTAWFNHFEKCERPLKSLNFGIFDARAFTIPERIEVLNYFLWRNADCRRNAISMVGQSLFSHKDLQKKSGQQVIDMIYAKTGKKYDDSYSDFNKNGRLILKREGIWVVEAAWNFMQDKETLLKSIPQYSYEKTTY